MSANFLLLTLLSVVPAAFPAIDYCDLNCGPVVNSACNCLVQGRRSQDLSDLRAFRKAIISNLNAFRSSISSTRSRSRGPGEASNMNVVSYDLELEHVARCYSIKYTFYKDSCRQTPKFKNPSQIIYKFATNQTVATISKTMNRNFYSTLSHVDNDTLNIDSYEGYKTGFSDLVHVLWWSHIRVGCARAYNPDAVLVDDGYVVICNFGSLDDDSVRVGKPVYKRGKACSECPTGFSCNSKYHRLCGTLKPVPEGESEESGGSGAGWVKGNDVAPMVVLGFCMHRF